jgi:putative transposase
VACGRAIRVLSVVDAYTRECLALEVDTSFASRRVTRVLEAIVAERGVPQAIRCDNGPELTSRHFLAWCVERQIELLHIQPGKPTQNARIESFHGRLRDECLAVSWFQNLFDARRKISAWRQEYNEQRPHSSLGYQTPKEFAELSRGKDGDKAALENASALASGVSHFSRRRLRRRNLVVFLREPKRGAGHMTLKTLIDTAGTLFARRLVYLAATLQGISSSKRITADYPPKEQIHPNCTWQVQCIGQSC